MPRLAIFAVALALGSLSLHPALGAPGLRCVSDAVSELNRFRQERFRFALLTERDKPRFRAIVQDPAVIAMSGEKINDDLIDWMLEKGGSAGADWEFLIFGLRSHVDDELMGFISLHSRLPDGSAQIGIIFPPEHWGKSLATEATRDLLRYATKELGLKKIQAATLTTNTGSNRVLEKIGFTMTMQAPTQHLGAAPGATDNWYSWTPKD